MKIVCGSCGAKYSIADEKVQGKVFKIRCKKCSNVIVVKGSSDEGEFGGGGTAAEWFVVINGDQVGPITSVEVDSYFMSGQIEATTYVWKDGMSDWIHLTDVPDFAHLAGNDAGNFSASAAGVAGTAGPDEATNVVDASHYQRNASNDSVHENPTVAESVSSDFGYASADPYAASAAAPASDDYGSGYGDSGFADSYSSEGSDYGYGASTASEAESGGGLFSQFDAPQPESAGDFMSFTSQASEATAAPSLGVSTGLGGTDGVADDMVGKRNENSVLFSLSSLDQVKAVSEPAPITNGTNGSGGGGVVEGSGLIDIKALATAHKTIGAGAGSPSVDPFAHGTMAMPALAPMGSHRSNKPLIIAAAVGGIVLVTLMGIVGYLLIKDDGPKEPQVIVERIVEKQVAVPAPNNGVAENPEVAAAEKSEADKAAEAVEKNEPPPKEDVKKTSKNVAASSKKDDKKRDEPKKDEPKKESTKKKKDPVDDLLSGLDKNKDREKAKPKEEKKSSSTGKSKLTKSDVQGTIKRYSGRVANCAKTSNKKNLSGTIKVKFFIKPTGRVTGAKVASSNFAGTDVGRCVQKVVSGMKFPKTDASNNLPVTYPFVVR